MSADQYQTNKRQRTIAELIEMQQQYPKGHVNIATVTIHAITNKSSYKLMVLAEKYEPVNTHRLNIDQQM